MTRALANTLLGLLAVTGLSFTLHQDLTSLALHQGTARLQSGDPSGAEKAFNRALSLGSDAAPLAYNLRVGLASAPAWRRRRRPCCRRTR